MFQKNTIEKIESWMILIITLAFFLMISHIIFLYFKDTKIFENSTFNLIILMAFYLIVYSFLINLYYKIYEFENKKDLLTKEELKKIKKKYSQFQKKILKKENKYPLASKRRLNQLLKELNSLHKERYKASIFFKSYIVFLMFSIYYGFVRGIPFAATKSALKYFSKAFKHFFHPLQKIRAKYSWDKHLENKDLYYNLNYFPPVK